MLALLSVACGARCGGPAARAVHAVPRAGPRVQNTDIEVQNYDIEVQNFDVGFPTVAQWRILNLS